MNIYLTDDSGRKFWNTSVSAAHSQGERNNLTRHLNRIKSGDPAYAKVGIDAKSARLVEELDRFDIQAADPIPEIELAEFLNMSDDDLLAALRS